MLAFDQRGIETCNRKNYEAEQSEHVNELSYHNSEAEFLFDQGKCKDTHYRAHGMLPAFLVRPDNVSQANTQNSNKQQRYRYLLISFHQKIRLSNLLCQKFWRLTKALEARKAVKRLL